MLNRVILMGRIAQDLELKQTQSGVSVLSFSVAVDRGYARQGEEKQTDFIDCVAWRQRAEFINSYFSKGRMIAIEGNLQKRTYEDRNGVKHYVTEVIVDNASFTGEPKQQGSTTGSTFSTPVQNNPVNNDSGNESIAIGDIDDVEVVISDDGVPF